MVATDITTDRSNAVTPGVGALLREWRTRRRMSQLDLASETEVSTRHLSYVETGRSTPSRELILHLARHLDVPHREQNDLLLAAGYAPGYSQLDLASPTMQPVVAALEAILVGNEPNPTLVMDRHWNLVMANESAFAWTVNVDPALLGPPLNVLRLTLHPDGIARRIENLDLVAGHLFERVRRQVAVTADPVLSDLLDEMAGLVPGLVETRLGTRDAAVTVRFDDGAGTREYLSVVSTFGTALDVTASELVIETFYDVTA
jgi:transcriptional regulator with XRE-family HTH domain